MRSRAGEGDGELDERFWAASGPNFGHGVEGGPDDMGGMGDFGDGMFIISCLLCRRISVLTLLP